MSENTARSTETSGDHHVPSIDGDISQEVKDLNKGNKNSSEATSDQQSAEQSSRTDKKRSVFSIEEQANNIMEEKTEAIKEDTVKDNFALALEYKEKGNEAIKKNDLEEAISLYTKAIEHQPDNHIFYSNRCAALMRKKRYEEALQDALKCTELEPTWPKGYLRLAHAYLESNELTKAEEAITKGKHYDKQKGKKLLSSFQSIQENIKKKKVTEFFEKIKGKWNATVNQELGGYEQELDFLSEKQVQVHILDRTVTADLFLDYDKRRNHFKMDMTVTFDPQTTAQTGQTSEIVRYITKLEGEELWICSADPLLEGDARPETFEGIALVKMKRGGLETDENSEIAKQVKAMGSGEKIKGYILEALEIFPENQRLMPLQNDSPERKKYISLLNVSFQTANFKITKKYGNETEEIVRNLLIGLKNPADFGDEFPDLVEQLKKKMQAALLLPPDQEVKTFVERQKDYRGNIADLAQEKSAEDKKPEVKHPEPKPVSKKQEQATQKKEVIEINKDDLILYVGIAVGVVAVAATVFALFRKNDS
eukprot:snap_masked-scaffold_29-processed-gene-0.40-mRNA-1 protein AED:0.06 eAED:0.06 QI:0/-1/0/1/-1/1/1/0/537